MAKVNFATTCGNNRIKIDSKLQKDSDWLQLQYIFMLFENKVWPFLCLKQNLIFFETASDTCGLPEQAPMANWPGVGIVGTNASSHAAVGC